jgi:hypothetical protein
MTMSKAVTLSLSNDEALVLFEWITRFNSDAKSAFEDQAEQRVLWDLEAQLESVLTEPLSATYRESLALARARVRDAVGRD